MKRTKTQVNNDTPQDTPAAQAISADEFCIAADCPKCDSRNVCTSYPLADTTDTDESAGADTSQDIPTDDEAVSRDEDLATVVPPTPPTENDALYSTWRQYQNRVKSVQEDRGFWTEVLMPETPLSRVLDAMEVEIEAKKERLTEMGQKTDEIRDTQAQIGALRDILARVRNAESNETRAVEDARKDLQKFEENNALFVQAWIRGEQEGADTGDPLTGTPAPFMDDDNESAEAEVGRSYHYNSPFGPTIVFVSDGISEGRHWTTYYRKPDNGSLKRVVSAKLQTRDTREEAQNDLDDWAEDHNFAEAKADERQTVQV